MAKKKQTELRLKTESRNDEQTEQLHRALETLLEEFGAEGVIKMVDIFQRDGFVRSMVRLKLKTR